MNISKSLKVGNWALTFEFALGRVNSWRQYWRFDRKGVRNWNAPKPSGICLDTKRAPFGPHRFYGVALWVCGAQRLARIGVILEKRLPIPEEVLSLLSAASAPDPDFDRAWAGFAAARTGLNPSEGFGGH